MQIVTVGLHSQLLESVKRLGRENAATLGFFPEGAFDEHASKGRIIACTTETGEFAGYLLFRDSHLDATIVHLCTIPSIRGKGVARLLFQSLIERTNHLNGIKLKCRTDFEANELWRRLQFQWRKNVPGKGKKGTELSVWWYPHDSPSQLSLLDRIDRGLIDVAMDTNILYDFCFEREGFEESRALLADWLSDEIELCITSELPNEISTVQNKKDKALLKNSADNYKTLRGPKEKWEWAFEEAKRLLGKPNTQAQTSDLLQLAYTYASGTQFFATRDGNLLRNGQQIKESLGIIVVSPSELVIQMDELRDEASYRPARLKGSPLIIKRVRSSELSNLVNTFFAPVQREKKSHFSQKIKRLLAKDESTNLQVVLQKEQPLALFAIEETSKHVIEIPIFRISQGPLASTISRGLLKHIIETSVRDHYTVVRINDTFLGSQVADALRENGFVEFDTNWVKILIPRVGTLNHLLDELNLIEKSSDINELANLITELRNDINNCASAEQALLLEKFLWPMKLEGYNIPNFMIPIKPEWAQDLFDEKLASVTLFGAKPDLIMNWENVYYRSNQAGGGLKEPCRILWYVTKDSRFPDTSCIRAVSYLSDVMIMPATKAFSRFDRLGVYQWQDVLGLAKGKPSQRHYGTAL